MTDIIVVGYPKSGNTWAARLVSELVGCPMVGYWGGDWPEVGEESLDRKSNYQCFKAHYQCSELPVIGTNSKKIIYVVRDPRDVCLSGSRYYEFHRLPFLPSIMKRIPKGQGIYKKIIYPIIATSNYRIKQMAAAVLYGSQKVDHWVAVPWSDHYDAYAKNECFIVKYEDLLDDPERECKRIISYLGVERDDRQISEAIEKQSFKKKKEKFEKMGETYRANFMKVGKKEQWREGLSKKQQKLFNEVLADDLCRLDYPLS